MIMIIMIVIIMIVIIMMMKMKMLSATLILQTTVLFHFRWLRSLALTASWTALASSLMAPGILCTDTSLIDRRGSSQMIGMGRGRNR
jgi:hypothetical protein